MSFSWEAGMATKQRGCWLFEQTHLRSCAVPSYGKRSRGRSQSTIGRRRSKVPCILRSILQQP